MNYYKMPGKKTKVPKKSIYEDGYNTMWQSTTAQSIVDNGIVAMQGEESTPVSPQPYEQPAVVESYEEFAVVESVEEQYPLSIRNTKNQKITTAITVTDVINANKARNYLYLLCIHCNDGGIVIYPDVFDITEFIGIHGNSAGFQFTSCKSCIKRISESDFFVNVNIPEHMQTLSLIGISPSFIENSQMYRDINKGKEKYIKIHVNNGRVKYTDIEKLYRSLTRQCKIQFYDSMEERILDHVPGGFF